MKEDFTDFIEVSGLLNYDPDTISKIYKKNPKRLLKRYKNTGVLKTHLILNHLTVLFNVFGEAAVPLLFYNLEEDLWPAIKSFLMFLRRIPEYPKSHIHGIPEDQTCIDELNSV